MENYSAVLNGTSPATNVTKSHPDPVDIFAGISAIIFTVIGFSGNLLTILVLCKHRKIRQQATTWFIVNLSISDLVFCTVELPVIAWKYLYGNVMYADAMTALCRIGPFFIYGNIGTSLMSMVAITINRYVLIAHFSWYAQIYTKRNILCMLVLVWLFIFGIMSLPLLGLWGEFGYNKEGRCTLIEKAGSSPKTFIYSAMFFFPCAVILLCYASIFIRVRRSRMNLNTLRSDSGTAGQGRVLPGNPLLSISKEDIQMIKMVLLTFCIFVGSFLPLMIVKLSQTDNPSSSILASVPVWSTCWTNLIIYVWCNQEYREAYAKFLFGLGRRGLERSNTSSRGAKSGGDP